MKRKIKINDKISGKVIEREVVIRATDHFNAQLKYKSTVYKPKKGKGSFKRIKKVDYDED